MNSRFLGRARVLGTLIGCASLLASGTSRAVSCASSFPRTPGDGATGVPTNTLLWSFNGTSEPAWIRLLGPGGEIGLEERSLALAGEGRRSVLRPVAELAPLTEYTVETTWLDRDGEPFRRSDGSQDVHETHFTTGAGPALGLPPLPRVVSSEAYVGYGWFGDVERSIQLSFAEHAGILIGAADGSAGSAEGLEDLLVPVAVPSGAEPPAQEMTWVTLQSWLGVGRAICLSWPGGTRVDGRFAVLDLAGNFSGWLEGVELALPSDDDVRAFVAANPQPEPLVPPLSASSSSAGGCQLGTHGSYGSHAASGAGALLLSVLALARRRGGAGAGAAGGGRLRAAP